jgi:hypothetical protein
MVFTTETGGERQRRMKLEGKNGSYKGDVFHH